jgi:bacterioferritin-associated ferredoxin
MIVCSCQRIDTEMIRSACRYVTEPNEKMVLNMLNWNANCANCGKVLVSEIRRVMKEVHNET